MNLIGITGYKKSGKDAVMNTVRQLLVPKKLVRVNFADALKEEVAAACDVTVAFIEENKDIFRPILQWWGTDFRRNLHGKNYWTEKWMIRLYNDGIVPRHTNTVVCTDVRFLNEAAMIRELGGRIVRVHRPGIVSDGHESERELEQIITDAELWNDGALTDLVEKVKLMLSINLLK